MTSAQVKAMRHSNMQIGAHTMSRPIFARLSDVEARAEIKGSKDCLLGERISCLPTPMADQARTMA